VQPEWVRKERVHVTTVFYFVFYFVLHFVFHFVFLFNECNLRFEVEYYSAHPQETSPINSLLGWH
jgi:hypothetical protein